MNQILFLIGCLSSWSSLALAQTQVIGETPPDTVINQAASDRGTTENWSVHFQSTVVNQFRGPMHSPYSTSLSLSPKGEGRTSLTGTLYLGRRLWQGATVFVNPELGAGSGISDTRGVAGYPNGEVYRVDTPSPKGNLSRLYLKQIFALGETTEKIEGEQNTFAENLSVNRLTLILGKFSLNDVFDDNQYAHDPRTQFLNWSLMDNGAWDYAADTRGYTQGFFIELNQLSWAIRFATVMEPEQANGLEMDTNVLQANAENLEFEYRYSLSELPGKARVLGFMNHAHMGSYANAIAVNPVPSLVQTREYRTKYGFGLNLEQALTSELGVFARFGWNDGKTESWTFTEIDRTASMGASLKGTHWKRESDTAGVAAIVNALSQEHRNYLAAGGPGFIIGDGQLNYSPEKILEIFYLYSICTHLSLTGDYQWIHNPAYNSDRGPASVFGFRLHYEF